MNKNVDILMMHEVKFVGFSLDISLKCIWRYAKTFSSIHSKGNGGISIIVGPKWNKHVKDQGVSSCNRAIWIVFNHNGEEFGVCSIQSPNDYNERIELWKWVFELEDVPWILERDFDMIERGQEKYGGARFKWKGIEQLYWNKIINKLKLVDPIVRQEEDHHRIWYTWTNFKNVDKRK